MSFRNGRNHVRIIILVSGGRSVLTLAELRYGIERMPFGVRRKRLDVWLRDALPQRFERGILPIETAVTDAWGKLVARREALGRPVSTADAFIAATAEVHNLTLVTRNVSDFEPASKAVVNPWTEA